MPEREHLRRLSNAWVKNPLYSVTICTVGRQKILAASEPAKLLIETWLLAPEKHGWAVGRYVIMPDHVHFFARPEPEGKKLSAFIRDWKKWTTKTLGIELGFPPPLWQPEFFDHVLRSAESYSEKGDYVRENPVRANLAKSAEAWPFSGECVVLTY